MHKNLEALAVARRRARVGRARLLAGCVLLVLAVGVLVATFLASRERKPVSPRPGFGHIHALALDPQDGALFVASHSGLYRIDRGARTASVVGDRYPDTMALAVAGADRVLASGHPDLRDNLPARLGLLASSDEGKRWNPVSLFGRADFHILRARGQDVVGYDATSKAILMSRDGGRHWRRSHFDGPLVDLAIAPAPLRALVATAPAQLLLSRDGGRSWGSVSETTGLLAWPDPRRLYLLVSDGRLWLSPDRGKRWRALGDVGGRPAALAVAADGPMYAALRDGVIKSSTDGGRSWRALTQLR